MRDVSLPALIFKNEFFLAVDKPCGYLTIPGRVKNRPVLTDTLAQEHGRVWPVHRLDAEVSGLVLFARTAEAHRAANKWFESRQVCKFYQALTEGEPQASWHQGQSFEWTSHLLRGKRRAYESPNGKPATTRAQWMGTIEFRGACVQRWSLEPLTGRSHQLRYELARHGFAILGDTLYGAHSNFKPDAIALRALRLDFSKCSDAAQFKLPASLKAVEEFSDA